MIFPGLFRGPGYCITVVLAGGQAWYSKQDYNRKVMRCAGKGPLTVPFQEARGALLDVKDDVTEGAMLGVTDGVTDVATSENWRPARWRW